MLSFLYKFEAGPTPDARPEYVGVPEDDSNGFKNRVST
jgi:hypothetical protein